MFDRSNRSNKSRSIRAAISLAFLASLVTVIVLACETSVMGQSSRVTLTTDDPDRDGWRTEVLHEAAKGQLARIAQVMTMDGGPSAGQLRDLIDRDFECSQLRPHDLRVTFKNGGLAVLRPASQAPLPVEFRQAEGLATALRQLVAESSDQHRVEFKIFGISASSQALETQQFLSIYKDAAAGGCEVHAVWKCTWTREARDGTLLLRSVMLGDYEETVVRPPTRTLVSDCTESVFGGNASYWKQLVFDLDHWNDRLVQMNTDGMQGLAVGDANGDGLDDVYICQVGPLPNRLFIQNGDGTATDVSAEAGVDWMEPTHSALFVDMDNNGHQDLLIATEAALLLMENDGTGKFILRAKIVQARDAYSLSAADYDQDGDLDLFACVYLAKARRRQVLAAPVPFHDARNGGRNVLLRNDGSWRLHDVTSAAGLEGEATRRSFASSWEDYDNDGDLDLYVANDYGRNNLFRNEGGEFIDVAAEMGVQDQSFGMSSSWGDFNRDGWMDLYVSNMFSAAGNRIVGQPQFRAEDTEAVREKFQYLARGNSLFQNNGQRFLDVSRESATMVGYWAWGSKFVDLNNDGLDDIVVANGFLTRSNPNDL